MTHFYRAFEDRHRGSRELIKSRLAAYVPFLAPLPAVAFPCHALDLGCGRGEWLELLGERGIAAHGVDLDDGMLAACRERGLDAKNGDALSALRAQPDASLTLVSAFHLVEHIPFEAVQELIAEALRVLKPGGLLIMETPNPENVVVGASNFYTDPSHLRPIPPLLLDFAVEFVGFARHKIVRLQEPEALRDAPRLELINVFNGVSPDYSIVAQKAAEAPISAAFDSAFAISFGLDLTTLAQRYDAQHALEHSATQARITQLSERLAAAELNAGDLFQRALGSINDAHAATRAVQAELHAAQLAAQQAAQQAAQEAAERAAREAREAAQRAAQEAAQEAAQAAAQEIAQRAGTLEQQAAARIAQAEQARADLDAQLQHVTWQLNEMTVRAQAAERKVGELYASSSWRLTYPARAAMTLLRRPLGAADVARMVAARNKARVGRMLMPLVRRLARHPGARTLAMRTLARFPGLENRVRSITYRALHGAPAYVPPAAMPATPTALPGQPSHGAPMPNLSLSAQKVFAELHRSVPSDDQPFN